MPGPIPFQSFDLPRIRVDVLDVGTPVQPRPSIGQNGTQANALSSRERKWLDALTKPGIYGKRAIETADVVLVSRRKGVSLATARIPALIAASLVRKGWAAWQGRGDMAVLKAIPNAQQPSAANQAEQVIVPLKAGETTRGKVLINTAESPLLWLARHKDGQGQPLISGPCFAAGERLRSDFTRAGMDPRLSVDWSGMPRSSNGGSTPAPAAEAVLAARQRLRQALDAVGSDFANLLLDVCCFLKRLEQVERDRHWPPRSGKIVIRLALERLADHYGLNRVAVGPNTGPRIRVWTGDWER
jgi:hypothetical protein